MSIEVSDIVISLCGRDRGGRFLVVDVDGSYVLLADGAGRRAEKPKRKKCKHVQLCGHSTAAQRLREGKDSLTNSEIRRALAECGAVDYTERGRN